jgi:hypothetical protein
VWNGGPDYDTTRYANAQKSLQLYMSVPMLIAAGYVANPEELRCDKKQLRVRVD